MWYGLQDIGSELLANRHGTDGNLREKEFWALRDINFEIKRGECLGLIGHNGAGKTTLLRMLNGLIKPDQGRIEMHGTVGALIALGAGFNPILTGRENVYVNAAVLGMNKEYVDSKIDEILFDNLMDKKVSHIIDCGGGDDTIKVLDYLQESDLKGLEYFIPANDDLEQVKNVLDTIKEIKKRDNTAKISIVLNRCNSLDEDEIKNQFIGIFGNESYGIAGVIDELNNQVDNFYFIKNTPIFGILKNIYKTTLLDSYREAKEITENISNYQKEWLKLGKDNFKSKMKFYKFLKDVVRFVENDLKAIRGV